MDVKTILLNGDLEEEICINQPEGLDRLRESRAQILWAMYNQMNVDYVALIWEDIMYQDDNREISSTIKEHMPYPRFTKVIINHFISKYNTISVRNRINLYAVRDDTLLDIKDSKAYKTYLDCATGKVPPKKAWKFKKPASPKLKTIPDSPKEPTQKGKRVKRPAKKATTAPTTGVIIRDTLGKSVSKKKAPAKSDRGKEIELLSDAALLEDAQLKKTMRKSKQETHKLQASGSNESDDVHDGDDNDDDDGNDDDNGNDDDGDNDTQDSKRTDLDDDENPSFTLKDYEEEEQDKEYMHTLEKDNFDDEDKMYKEEDDDVTKELYGYLNIT
nr:hypothetical protein [Tanacetum cinerariifolium]